MKPEVTQRASDGSQQTAFRHFKGFAGLSIWCIQVVSEVFLSK